ncbi:glycosyltransferase [Sulfurimonas sp. SAG-AH-194-C20]|nr:glycosyltransferase [Sulfurimonas sp. SAG-AH-194-C20]MDF1878458.1 glycosyltransferase [Sulfurimonas sp. SAG-AH-194-C20]
MSDLKVSLVVAVYKDIEALKLIVENLKLQTYKNFELIVAEDGESSDMREYIESLKEISFHIIHATQEDNGIRKSMSQNNAIRVSTGKYLIFIDGDCIPYSTFIEYHVKLAENKYFLGGKRVNLGPKYSAMLRSNKLLALDLEKNFFIKYFNIKKDALEKHSEEGFSFAPNSLIYNLFLKNRKKKLALVGCNFSCFKEDMLKINGFNEELGDAAVASDTDIQWRLEAIGLKVKSCKFVANEFHLYHKRSSSQARGNTELYMYNKNHNNYVATHGIVKKV